MVMAWTTLLKYRQTLREVATQLTNPRLVYTDGDFVSHGGEVNNGTGPLVADSDVDGFDEFHPV